jgi:hypothetical protein
MIITTNCNIFTTASSNKILTRVGFDPVAIYTGAQYINPYTKLHFIVGYKLKLPKYSLNIRYVGLNICVTDK